MSSDTNPSVQLRAGSTSLRSSLWASSTAIIGKSGSTSHASMGLVVSVGIQTSNNQAAGVAYSCDVPLITHLSRTNFPSSFDFGIITISGSGFGIYGSSPLVRIGSTLAIRNIWRSHSSLIFTPNFGTATRLPGVNVQVSALGRFSAETNR